MKSKNKLKIIFVLAVIFAFISAPSVFVFAASDNNYVTDEAGVLTGEQIASLNAKAGEFTQKRECGVYIYIVDLVPEEYAVSINSMERYADAFFRGNNLGYGENKNGILLILETGDIPGERDYLFYTNGPCTSFFNNDRRERVLDDKILPLLDRAYIDGNFYRVADAFIDEVENEYAISKQTNIGFKLIAIIALPLLIAGIMCSSWKSQMKTAKPARAADNYIPENGFRLTNKSDMFLYRTTKRVKIQKSSSGGSGGSRSSSSGRSSGGKR